MVLVCLCVWEDTCVALWECKRSCGGGVLCVGGSCGFGYMMSLCLIIQQVFIKCNAWYSARCQGYNGEQKQAQCLLSWNLQSLWWMGGR